MMYSTKWRDPAEPRFPSECHTGMEILAGLGAAASVGSIGMGILGASQQSDAQRQAGEIAYQNALIRQQQLNVEAQQREAQAKEQQAASQRQAIEADREARIKASRAIAVMAGSGAGVDDRLVAGILGEGNYGRDVALYEGESKATALKYQANLNRYEGDTGVYQGARARAAYNQRADATLTYGILGAGLQAASLASKYAPSAPPTDTKTLLDPRVMPSTSSIDYDIGQWSKYGRSP
jgi:hypothetical protein